VFGGINNIHKLYEIFKAAFSAAFFIFTVPALIFSKLLIWFLKK